MHYNGTWDIGGLRLGVGRQFEPLSSGDLVQSVVARGLSATVVLEIPNKDSSQVKENWIKALQIFWLEPVAKYWQWSANRFPCYLLSSLLSSEWYLTTLGEESCLQWRKTLKRWFLFHGSDQTDQARASKNTQNALTWFHLTVLPKNSWLANLY